MGGEFKWRHFAGELILLCVRWYCRYGISYRDLEEMMAERGVAVDVRGGGKAIGQLLTGTPKPAHAT